MVHPILRGIEDSNVAEACDDAFHNDYTFFTKGEVDEQGRSFPNEPSHVVSILAAYIEPVGTVRRQIVGLMPELLTDEVVGTAYSSLLGDAKCLEKDVMDMADELRIFAREGGLQGYYLGKVLEGKKRLVAAHFVAQSLEGGRIQSALAYPKSIKTDLPLRFRDAVTPALKQAEEDRRAGISDDVEEVEVKLRPFIQLQKEITETVGVVAAVTFLPGVDELRSRLPK